MKSLAFVICLLLSALFCSPQTERIPIQSITPSENTGQDYSPWLNDNVDNVVTNVWYPVNMKYIDVTLQLEKKCRISKLSLYDFEGVFTDNPATFYAVSGGQKTFLGTFTGETYKQWVDITIPNPAEATALVVHKFGNNIPMKIKVFGYQVESGSTSGSGDGTSTPAPVQTMINFSELPVKTTADPAFPLSASSNNTQTPITFASSNASVVTVSHMGGAWMATITGAGTATITASQVATENYTAATSVRTLMVQQAAAADPGPDANAGSVLTGKIPVDPKRWFQLTNASNGLDGLFDGQLNQQVVTGWGKILEQYDSYYPLLQGEEMDIESVRFYDGEGANPGQPMTLFAITSSGEKINIGTFTGSQYNTWVGPYPDNQEAGEGKFNLKVPVKNVKYLMINSWNFFPAEIEIYGTYKAGKSVTAAVKKPVPLKQMFGVNAFEWDMEAPNNPSQIDEQRMAALKGFSGIRHYMDWEKLELSEGNYTFNPVHSGGWNYDALYERCKAEGIEVLACLKTIPGWMQNTYPSYLRDWENTPLRYGKDAAYPNSYIEQAKVAFQFAARYGSNKNVDRSLLHVNQTPRWPNDQINTVKVGLDLIRYIECDNERDKWWKGRKAYQTAYEYAANLSAFYDGNKNTMGAGVGVKNADPHMKVVMGGLALASTDYIKGMVDWCRQHRGYRSDGSVDVCWDVINYHFYANDSKNSQSGSPTRGAAPEISGAAEEAADFLQTAHEYTGDLPVWVTELGYDINQGSPYKAVPIGNKSALQTQADWILRSALLYERAGAERIFFYELYDDNLGNPVQFSSSGLINADKTRKPAADFLYQANKLLGEYTYAETVNNDPLVDRYFLNEKSAFVLMIPDEKGRTATYTLDLGNADGAYLYTPKAGSNVMDVQKIKATNGKVVLTVTETPVFVLPDWGNAAKAQAVVAYEENLNGKNNLLVFPNPATQFITLAIRNEIKGAVQVRLFDAGSGRILKTMQYKKTTTNFSEKIDISLLPDGLYLLEAKQGNWVRSEKFLKTNKSGATK